MTYGKAFGGGVMPITGIIARPKMWTQKLIDNPWILGSPTFGGNPLACSAAIATIRYMLENDIPKMCEEKGNYFMEKLNGLMKKYPTVLKAVRGAGLLICMEFPEAEVGYKVVKGLFDRKVMTAGTLVTAKTVRIEPPAVIEYKNIDLVLERLDEALADAKAEFKL
jgi:putrescine aminotransferase